MAKKRQKSEYCLNCKTELPENYNFCPACGQENDQKIKPITSYVDDSFHDWFAFDNRLWRSIVPFLFRPAYLTKAYSEGRRQDYITPVRLYLTMSVLCFFALSLVITSSVANSEANFNTKLTDFGKDDTLKINKKEVKTKEQLKEDSLKKIKKAKKAKNKPPRDSTKKENSLSITSDNDGGFSIFGENIKIKDPKKAKKILDSKTLTQKQKMDSLKIKNTFWNYLLAKQITKVAESTPNELFNYVMNKLPIVMFVLLPFFAWLLHLFYLFSRRKYYYIESLVFTLHTHSFVFFTFFIGILLSFFNFANDDVVGIMWGLILLINMIYIFVAQKRFYQQGYILTFIKYSIYSFLYTIVLFLGLFFGIAFTMLFFY